MKSAYFFPLIGVLGSLLWAYVSFRYFIYYNSRVYTKVGKQDENWRRFKKAQVSLLVSSLAFIVLLVNLFNLAETTVPPPAITTFAPGEGAGQLSSTPSPFTPVVPSLPPENSPTPEVVSGSGFARIGNTNGFGANVRTEPGLAYELLTQLSDGSRIELTGEVQLADGFSWQRIRLVDGRLGWIADNFLIPEP
jgi:hypothetical protein